MSHAVVSILGFDQIWLYFVYLCVLVFTIQSIALVCLGSDLDFHQYRCHYPVHTTGANPLIYDLCLSGAYSPHNDGWIIVIRLASVAAFSVPRVYQWPPVYILDTRLVGFHSNHIPSFPI